MKARSLILPDPLIRAALAGRVTEIRVPMKPQPELTAKAGLAWKGHCYGMRPDGSPFLDDIARRGPLGAPGDRLVVREAWAPADDMYGVELDIPQTIAYRADRGARVFAWGGESSSKVPKWDTDTWNWDKFRWRSATQMPLWASRLAFDVLAVRVERIQDMVNYDAIACGLVDGEAKPNPIVAYIELFNRQHAATARASKTGLSAYGLNLWCWIAKVRRVG